MSITARVRNAVGKKPHRRTKRELDYAQIDARIRNTDPALIAAKLKQARQAAGLTHDQLGVLVGGRVASTGRKTKAVSRQHLIKLEQAKHRPRAELLTKLAQALDQPVDWFLSGEEVSHRAPLRPAEDAV